MYDIRKPKDDGIDLPRYVYPDPVLADGGIFARNCWGLLAFVSSSYQEHLSSPKHSKNYLLSIQEEALEGC